MKRFQFSLERIQRYKQQLLDLEKNKLAALQRQLAELDEKIAVLRQDRAQRHKELQRQQFDGIFAQELKKVHYFLENEQIQIQQLTLQRADLQKQIDRQLAKVVAASRESKSIDKLEEKQRMEYQQEQARQNSEEIAELVIQNL